MSGSENDGPPPGYIRPDWPSLYLPWLTPIDLYYTEDIWRFTVYWAIVLHGIIFGIAGAYAALNFGRQGLKRVPFSIGVPLVLVGFQIVVAFLAATILGFALAAIYTAAYLRMSTWIPLLWVIAQTLVTVASSYTTVDVLL